MIKPENWTPIDGLKLESNAYKAVTSSKNMVVSAGPGAGKTELLAQRADFLFRTGACRYPRRILAISFKVDAAHNLSERVRKRSGSQYAERFDSMTFDAFAKMLVDNYRVVLSGKYRLNEDYEIDAILRDHDFQADRTNFHQLIDRAYQILNEVPYALAGLRQAYGHVFMDEFQDTTDRQYELAKCIFQGVDSIITAVGDTKQTIMRWAGALDGIMREFQTDFSAEEVHLYRNFRSWPKLQRAQRNIMQLLDPSAALSVDRIEGNAGDIYVFSYHSNVEEAEHIAEAIKFWIQNGTKPSEIAVLVRQQPEFIAQSLMNELQKSDIAYCNEAKMQNLLTEPVAAVIFNFLRVIIRGSDPDAYIALKQFAERAIITEEAVRRFDARLDNLILQATQTIRSASFGGADHSAWKILLDELWELFPDSLFRSLYSSYHQSRYLQELKEKAYNTFFEELSIDGNPASALRRLSGEDAVRILTIHKSKGLEFEKVVVLGVEHELFWSRSTDYVPCTTIPKEVIHTFFVAISRAKHELVLTFTSRREEPANFIGRNWYFSRHPYNELITPVQNAC